MRAPGQNPPGGEAATAAVLEQVCRERGLAVEAVDVAPERPNVRAVLAGGDGPGLLLLGHTDVVPVGDGWTVDPFGGEVRDGRLYGRGSTDMKGGLAACVVAMTALRREGVALSGPVELAALVDEEEHGLGIRGFVADGTARRTPRASSPSRPTSRRSSPRAATPTSTSSCTGRRPTPAVPTTAATPSTARAAVIASLERCTRS